MSSAAPCGLRLLSDSALDIAEAESAAFHSGLRCHETLQEEVQEEVHLSQNRVVFDSADEVRWFQKSDPTQIGALPTSDLAREAELLASLLIPVDTAEERKYEALLEHRLNDANLNTLRNTPTRRYGEPLPVTVSKRRRHAGPPQREGNLCCSPGFSPQNPPWWLA